MERLQKNVNEAVDFLNAKWPGLHASVAVILGSWLGQAVETFHTVKALHVLEIPHWPKSTVQGHEGRLVFAQVNHLKILFLQGRVHYYEGYSIQEVVFPVRVFAQLGVKMLILTNAAGGIRKDLKPGDLMCITDHLNLMGTNPLIGPHHPSWGERFPDLSNAYSSGLIDLAEKEAKALGFRLKKGILAAVCGPSYETKAEVQMLKRLGADAVCMSTVPEVIVANQMGMEVLGISCIANRATGLGTGPLSHEEVREKVHLAMHRFGQLLHAVFSKISMRLESDISPCGCGT